MGLSRSSSTASRRSSPFGPGGLSPRRHYGEGTAVTPYTGGCCGPQWTQVEINETVLHRRKGDLRGLSPDPAPPGPPPAPQLGRPRGTRVAAGVPQSAAPGRPARPSSGATAQGGRRVLPVRSSGSPGPAVSGWVRRGLRLGSRGSWAPWARPASVRPGISRPLSSTHGPGNRTGPAPASSLPGRAGGPLSRRGRADHNTFSRPPFSSTCGLHGDRARQPDSPTA